MSTDEDVTHVICPLCDGAGSVAPDLADAFGHICQQKRTRMNAFYIREAAAAIGILVLVATVAMLAARCVS